ncbi:type II toxin-antitoxin system RelE/ParE family toxin [Halobacteriovorax sp. HLS]|uniref:type II toxin-antitoxin system RelE/ParE family toxin n=1 Tax=Halobacteriovorax sp. HLS TaxID=2234000 RepID=UPI000FD72EB9|nr:type II toxin-antitoxin system RelE/ParE family toxin [Halobacteriovorax sp. HLS]
MIRTFVETDIFKALLDQEGDKGLEATIKNNILEDPSRGDVIAGTGGVRKFRVSDKSRRKGKRGGFRILYVDLPKCKITYLLFLYNKDELENISSHQKKALRKIVEGVKNECEKKKT